MRRMIGALAIASLAASAHAQESTEVKLVAPLNAIAISLGVEDTVKLKVFFTSPRSATITITDVGPLIAGKQIGFVTQTPVRPYTFDLVVDGKGVKPGETHSGSVLFRTTDSAPIVSVPVTVTRAATAFTAAATPTDICLSCGEPRVISVQITNSGKVPLAKMKVGTVIMSDASRGHRWILPRAGRERCGAARLDAGRSGEDGKIVIRPCSEGAVDLAPGESRTISVAIEPPQRAGDYATTIELSAPGAPSVSISLVLHVRGPGGASWWPPILFVVTVLSGFGIAHSLERLFGAGGAARRTKALISLRETRDELAELQSWAEMPALPITMKRIAADIFQIDTVIRDGVRRSVEEIEKEGIAKFVVLEKRRRLKQRVDYARTQTGLEHFVAVLDKAPDDGEVEAYDASLATILTPAMKTDLVNETVWPGEPVEQLSVAADGKRHRLAYWRMQFFRSCVLALVSLISAYGVFYATGCNFGSLANYIAVFLWALGLTRAGKALVDEVAAPPKPPATSRTAGGAAGGEAN